MDENLKIYLLSLGFSAGGIDDLLKSCPGLRFVDSNEAIECMELVVKYGYPHDELMGLVCQNPSFLLCIPDMLEIILKSMGLKVEKMLKNDPFLI